MGSNLNEGLDPAVTIGGPITGANPVVTLNGLPTGGGTVTSVGLALPAEFSISGSPVTTSGTLTGAWATQTANKVFAGPSSGSAAAPAFRTLVTSDLPPVYAALFGTGSDGALSLSGASTPTRSMHYTTVTLSAGAAFNQNGLPHYVSVLMDSQNAPAGSIVANGNNGNSGATGNALAPGATTMAASVFFGPPPNTSNVGSGANGGAGATGAGAQGSAPTASGGTTFKDFGGAGGLGGAGGAVGGTAGGAQRAAGAISAHPFPPLSIMPMYYSPPVTSAAAADIGPGGAGGGGGAGDGASSGGAGGSGGSSGGYIEFWIRALLVGASTAAGFVRANGGNGGNGGSRSSGTNVGGGGGGGGGAGGFIRLIVGSVSGSASDAIEAVGGTGGNGGTHRGTGNDGAGGSGGYCGRIVVINLDSGLTTDTGIVAAGSAASGATGGAGASATVSF